MNLGNASGIVDLLSYNKQIRPGTLNQAQLNKVRPDNMVRGKERVLRWHGYGARCKHALFLEHSLGPGVLT